MGEIAEMMLDGTLCEACGCYIDDEGGGGFPRYCSRQCAGDRGYDCDQPKAKPFKCEICGKKFSIPQAVEDHKKSVHAARKEPADFIQDAKRKIGELVNLYGLSFEWRNPEHPNYEIAILRKEGVSLCVYPHKTKGGNRHARIRDLGSKDKDLAAQIIGASGFHKKGGI